MRRADSRFVISALVGILAVTVFALTGRVAWQAYGENVAAKRVTYLNSLTDKIILASSVAAVERGLTSAALGTAGAADAALSRRIDESRREVDVAWQEILTACRSDAANLAGDADFSRLLEQARERYQQLALARGRADNTLRQRSPGIGRAEWIETISRFIESTAALREVMVAHMGVSRAIVQLNMSLKQRIWFISEHAGLERGILAYYVSAGRPVPGDILADLRSFRSIVEHNLRGISALRTLPETDHRVARAIGEMEQNFLGRFDPVRASVYEAARRGDYRLTSKEWFDSATGAIGSVLAVMRVSSAMIEEKAGQDEKHSMRGLVLYAGIFGASAVLTVFILIWVIRVTNALFHQKELAEVTLHSIGDAVITTDAFARVEYLNPIAEDLTGWSTAQATGMLLKEVFNIVNGSTREPQSNPIERCLKERRIISLENNTVLIRRDGQEFIIEDSAAPVRDREGNVVGAVMVFYDVTKSRNMPHLLSYQATHDALTGLINRREFERRLLEMLESARNEGKQHALCYLDLDQFKVINDTCGHAAGDRLLRQLTPLLKARMREPDSLARLGGDEFGVLLEMCPIEMAAGIAEDLCHITRDFRFDWLGKVFEIGASIGVVPITPESVSVADIMSEADAACYAAKDKGRSRVQVYQPGDAELMRRHGEMQWVTRLTWALEENRFRLYHQKILPLTVDDGSHPCCEILLRLLDENGEIIPPTAFIPAAERYNLMPAIDRWVIRNTFAQFGKSRCGSPEKPCHGYAVNLSGASLGDEHFLDFIYEQFALYHVPPQAICFEITETAVISSLDRAMEFILALRRKGCRFALDDFGSGLSSFVYLKNLPVDYLKITGTFVRNLADPTDCAMVDAIHRVGQVMGIKTIAEFVETGGILEKLRELGVNFAQGYGISHPKPLMEEPF
jgi:diguanylate cyclase (GGDEF)-like protein/PAS domain S-box-containing protein